MASAKRATGPRRIVDGLLTIEIGPEVETCLVQLAGELDVGTVPALEAEVQRLLASDLQSVILDLEDLEFIDSTGAQCLLRVTSRSRADGDRLRMLAPTDQVERVLKLTGLYDVLPLIGR